MANKVVIDVEARFIDNVSGSTNAASKSVEGIGKSADKAQKELDKLSKKKAKPIFDADDNKFINKIRSAEAKMQKMGRTKTAAVLDLVDKATVKIRNVINKGQEFGRKVWKGMLEFNDSKAVNVLRKVTNAAEKLTKKTWTALVRVKDMALAPIKAIKNALFSIPTLITAVVSAKVVQEAILKPINLADQYSSAKIGFSTLLGDSAGQAMMDKIDLFAKKTPFKTSGVISNVQKMMAYGWDVDRVIEDMETIGDAAAATGKGDQGLESIVYALSEIRSKGKLSTQELNQLASAGIKAKAYLAEGLGFGTDDAGMKQLADALEDGAVGANQAIDLILEGMKEFDGMMDRTANETVEGLKSQLEDVFEINIARRWGQGLQDGAKKGLGYIVSLLDDADDSLAKFGDTVFEVGQKIGNWFANKLGGAIDKINKITESYDFKNASLKEKVSMLWNGVIVDPLKEWWESGGRDKTAETAGKIGAWMGKAITSSLLAIFGATEVLKDIDGADMGGNIAGSFVQGFLQNFDGSAITQALVDAIANVWNALPTWGKMLVGGYGISKAVTTFGPLVSGLMSGGKAILGSTGNAMVGGSGVLGKLASIGYNATGGAANAAGYFGKVGGMSGAKAAMYGGLKVAGLVGLPLSAYHVFDTAGQAIKSYKSGDKIGGRANLAKSGATAIGMGVGTVSALGAAKLGGTIGTFFGGPIGTAVGAGLGGLLGWLAGDKIAKHIEAARYESEEMKEAIKNGKKSSEELAEIFERNVFEKAQKCFGDIELSMEEISRLSKQMVWGDDMQYFEKFQAATKGAEQSLQSMKAAAQDADKWMWKASLGVKFNDDEKEAFKLSFDDYLSNAKSLLENKHYEFAMAAQLVLDLESETGKSILEGGNAFYAQAQQDLEAAGTELGNALTSALADGFVNADEQAAINAAQEKVAKIMERISDAEMKAELKLAEVKLSEGNMEYESFQTFMDTMESQIQERVNAQDEAVKLLLSNIELRYTDENGNITNWDAYQTEVQDVINQHKLKIDKIKADVMGYELNVISESFDGADMLGSNAKQILSDALNEALTTNIDPIKWDSAKLQRILGTDSLSSESQELIQRTLSNVFHQLQLMNVDVESLLNLSFQAGDDTEEKAQAAIRAALDGYTTEEISLLLTGIPYYQNNINVLASDFGISDQEATTILWNITAHKTIQEKITYIKDEFGIPEEDAATLLWKLTGQKDITPIEEPTKSEFGILDSYGPYNTTVKVNANVQWSTSGNSLPSWVKSPKKYRGGIVGGSSAMSSFYRGGIAGFSDGGMVRGGSQLIEVAEEGSPEMIIPLSSQRRGRALKLWAQAGNIMGVPGFARGGMTSDNNDEGIRFSSYSSDSNAPSGGQTVQIDIGGLTFEINVNGGGDATTITEAIKAQAAEIADMVAGVLADSLSSQFENMPAR